MSLKFLKKGMVNQYHQFLYQKTHQQSKIQHVQIDPLLLQTNYNITTTNGEKISRQVAHGLSQALEILVRGMLNQKVDFFW